MSLDDPLEERLRNMAVPQVQNDTFKKRLWLTLLDARRSAWWGSACVLLPAVFLLAVFLQYGLGIAGSFDPLDHVLFEPIRNGAHWVEPLLLFVLPLAALVANVLAIAHFSTRVFKDHLVITVAVRKHWWNWAVITVSAAIVAIIFLYAIGGDRR